MVIPLYKKQKTRHSNHHWHLVVNVAHSMLPLLVSTDTFERGLFFL